MILLFVLARICFHPSIQLILSFLLFLLFLPLFFLSFCQQNLFFFLLFFLLFLFCVARSFGSLYQPLRVPKLPWHSLWHIFCRFQILLRVVLSLSPFVFPMHVFDSLILPQIYFPLLLLFEHVLFSLFFLFLFLLFLFYVFLFQPMKVAKLPWHSL